MITRARYSEIEPLHPAILERIVEVAAKLEERGSPLRVYETGRHPRRQGELFARGRTVDLPKPGEKPKTVTRARAWGSAHQYLLAADFAGRRKNGTWWWPARDADEWKVFAEVVAEVGGLETLSFEKPHVQLAGFRWEDWYAREVLEGTPLWRDTLEAMAEEWTSEAREVLGIVHPTAPAWVLENARPPLAA